MMSAHKLLSCFLSRFLSTENRPRAFNSFAQHEEVQEELLKEVEELASLDQEWEAEEYMKIKYDESEITSDVTTTVLALQLFFLF